MQDEKCKEKLEKSSWQMVVGCDKVNKLSLESDWENHKSETEKNKKSCWQTTKDVIIY